VTPIYRPMREMVTTGRSCFRPRPPLAAEVSRRAEIADEYVRFVEQTLYHAARNALRLAGEPVTGDHIAATMALLTRALFNNKVESGLLRGLPPGLVDVEGHDMEELLSSLASEASKLRQRVCAVTSVYRWDFEADIGRQPGADTQQPWRRSDPELPVTRVVAPALTIDGRIVCKQWVTTG
jgi:hypothetical protein